MKKFLARLSSIGPRITAFRASGWGTLTDCFLLAAFGGMFTWAFPGVDIAPLIWIGLLPVYLLSVHHSFWSAFLRGYVWAFFWNLTAFFWLREIELPIPLAAGIVLGFFPALWAGINAWLYANLAFPVRARLGGERELAKDYAFRNPWNALLFLFSSSAVWVMQEWVRGWIFTGLPWNNLATALWRNILLIQNCEIFGVYGLTFVIVCFNIGLAMSLGIFHRAVIQNRYIRPWPLMAACCVIALSIGSGLHLFKKRSAEAAKFPVHRIGVIQCDLSQRRHGSYESSLEALTVCVNLSRKLLERKDKPEVIIWPETAVPHAYGGGSEISELYRHQITNMLLRYQVPFLVGSLEFEESAASPVGYEVYNSALLLTRPGTPVDSYKKVHLVPFGEYVPWGNEFPVLNQIVGMGRNLAPGTRFNPIEIVPGVRAGISICFDSVFSYISRGHALNGANLLLVISNDAWYPTSNEPVQHFANGILRTVETRLPMLRSGNSDFTAVIDSLGRVTDSVVKETLPDGSVKLHLEAKQQISSILKVPCAVNPQPTFYTRYGNVFIVFCGLIFAVGALPALVNWFQYRGAQADPEKYKQIMNGQL